MNSAIATLSDSTLATVSGSKGALQAARVAFPAWRGRKVSIARDSAVSICGTSWDGGSRNEFVAIDLRTGRVVPMSDALRTPAEMGGMGGAHRVNVPAGFAIVEHSIYCGKDVGCTVYIGR